MLWMLLDHFSCGMICFNDSECYNNFIFILNCRSHVMRILFFFFCKNNDQWCALNLDTGGHCWIRWSNGPLSDLNRSNDDNLLYNLSCTEVSRHIHNIMKIPLYFEDTAWKNGKICVFPLLKYLSVTRESDNCIYTAINSLPVSTKNS